MASPPPHAASNVLLTRPIPTTGEALPVIGLGTYRAFDVLNTPLDYAPLKNVLQTFTHGGGVLIDSSPMYGRAETTIGEVAALAGVADKFFYATKVWTNGRDAGIQQMRESYLKLGVDTLDLMQIHNLLDWRTHTKTLQEWQAQKRVRYIGITHYHEGAYNELERLLKTKAYDFVQLNFSIAERAAEARLLPLAQELGVAVIVNRPFAQANLFRLVRGTAVPEWAAEFDCASWGQFFLKFILANPAVTCAIPATGNPSHMADNLLAGQGRLPDSTQRKQMVALLEKL